MIKILEEWRLSNDPASVVFRTESKNMAFETQSNIEMLVSMHVEGLQIDAKLGNRLQE